MRVRGRCPRAGATGIILAPNHQSWLDPLMVQYAVLPQRITFLMTERFFDLPVAGLYFRATGARPIREQGPSVAGMRAAIEALEKGEVICLFPEGGITRTGEMGGGRRGVARLARRTGALVVPVAVDGTMRIYSPVQRRPRRGRVTITIGSPRTYAEPHDRDGEGRFTDRLMSDLRALLGA